MFITIVNFCPRALSLALDYMRSMLTDSAWHLIEGPVQLINFIRK